MQTAIFPSVSLKTILIWSLLILTTFDLAASNMTFTIFAGQSFTIYLDRSAQAFSLLWSYARTLTLSDNISIIAVQATKDRGYPGMIASTTDSNYILTNSSWKCKNGLTRGDVNWTSYNFNDDNWYDASQYGRNQGAIGNVRSGAFWIWTYYEWNANDVVHCRRRIGRALTYIAAPVSNIYLNGQQQFGVGSSKWEDGYLIHLPTDLQVIGIKSNVSVYDPWSTGLIAYTYDGYIVTNSSWKCTNQTPDTSWTDVCYDDSSWPDASTYGFLPDTSSGYAYRIWTLWSATSYDLLVYCRYKLGMPTCPKPSTITTVKRPGTAATKSVTNSTFPDSENLLTTQRAHPENQEQPNTTATSRMSGMNALGTGTTGAIIGGAVGAFGAVLLIVVLVVFIICFIKKRRKLVERTTGVALVGNEYGESPSSGVQIPDQILPDPQLPNANASINENKADNHYENIRNNNRLTFVPPQTYEYLTEPPAKDDSHVRFQSSTGESNNPDVLNDTSANSRSATGDVDTTLVENDLYTKI